MSVQAVRSWRTWMWCLWLVAAMMLLAFLDLTVYGLVVPASALLLALLPDRQPGGTRASTNWTSP